jgi:hypothetical protein
MADQVPLYSRVTGQQRDFRFGLLDTILTEQILACGDGFRDSLCRKSLADGEQLNFLGPAARGQRSRCDSLPDMKQILQDRTQDAALGKGRKVLRLVEPASTILRICFAASGLLLSVLDSTARQKF